MEMSLAQTVTEPWHAIQPVLAKGNCFFRVAALDVSGTRPH